MTHVASAPPLPLALTFEDPWRPLLEGPGLRPGRPARQAPPPERRIELPSRAPLGPRAKGNFVQVRAQAQVAEASPGERAHEVLRRIVRDKDVDVRAEVKAWAAELERAQEAGRAPTVEEHTTLTFVLRSGLFDHPEDPAASPSDLAELRRFNGEVRQQLERCLGNSWRTLTGEEPTAERRLERLPARVLRKATRKARVYHAAAFLPIGDRRAQRQASRLLRDYVPESSDQVVITGALLAAIFSDVGRWVVANAILQYGVYSLTENILHNHLAHPRGKIGEWMMKGPGEDAGWLERGLHRVFGRVMASQVDRTEKAHMKVHHGWTYRRSFTQRFDDKFTQAQVDTLLDRHFPADLAAEVRDEEYATMLKARGMAKIFSTVAPQTLAIILAGAAFGAPAWCLVPTLLLAAAYPVAMGKLHPIYHVSETEAKANATGIVKALRQTRYVAYSARNHWMHHHVDGNYNLSFPGADALLGMLVQPNLEDLFRMAEEDVLHHAGAQTP